MKMEDLDLDYDEFMKGYPAELELMDLLDWIKNSKCFSEIPNSGFLIPVRKNRRKTSPEGSSS